ncbi:MAG: type II secretion system F family protein, partial [Betaproteobacteria bacterium]|nr:type II secretion system F family protein [Betaproteobacteria bacterium]
DDVILFSRQMYTMEKSGIPLLRSLAGLQESASKPAVAQMINELRTNLDAGRELSASMARQPGVFSEFYLSMIRVGELTGRLSEVFLRLFQHLEFEKDVRARIIAALRYPTFVLVAMGAALIVINVFVIPVFAKVFAGFKAELPLITRILIGFSNWMVNSAPLLIFASIIAILGIRAYVRTQQGRYRWDKLKLRLPISGDIVLKSTLARFARSFAIASESGVPVVQAMTVLSRTVDNSYIGARIEEMRDGISRGESLLRCAQLSGVFTPIVLQMIAVGEETGAIDKLMSDIADMYERETDYAIKGLSAAIEPILLVIMAGLVLILALGVFLPLWNLGNAAMGRGGG